MLYFRCIAAYSITEQNDLSYLTLFCTTTYLINSLSFCNKTFNLLMFDSRKIIVLSWLIERRFSNIHNDLPFEDCYLIDLFLFCSLTTWCCLVMKCSISWSLISELSLVILSMSPMAELLCNPIDFLFLVYLMSSCI